MWLKIKDVMSYYMRWDEMKWNKDTLWRIHYNIRAFQMFTISVLTLLILNITKIQWKKFNIENTGIQTKFTWLLYTLINRSLTGESIQNKNKVEVQISITFSVPVTNTENQEVASNSIKLYQIMLNWITIADASTLFSVTSRL